MTALYTNYRYEREAYKEYKVDGYMAKPLAVDTLSKLLKQELGDVGYGHRLATTVGASARP